MRKILTVVLAAATVLIAAPAHATVATFGDPNDVRGGLDVKSSTIRIFETATGGHRVQLEVRTYDAFDLAAHGGSFYWQLDTAGTRDSVEYAVFMFADPDADNGPLFCLLKAKDGTGKTYVKVAQPAANAMRCTFPRAMIHPARFPGWRLAGRKGDVIDRAPNTGWYRP
jgi:hypothetical protein